MVEKLLAIILVAFRAHPDIVELMVSNESGSRHFPRAGCEQGLGVERFAVTSDDKHFQGLSDNIVSNADNSRAKEIAGLK